MHINNKEQTTTNSYEETIKAGAKGYDVASLQNHLWISGFYRGSINGHFGADTTSAVRQFQLRKGLNVDGIADTLTWKALKSSAANLSPPKNINIQKGFPFESGKAIHKNGIVSNTSGAKLHAEPSPTSTQKKRLPFNTRLFVSRELTGDWLFITLADGNSGFVYKKNITTNLPEPKAILHKIKRNEGALSVVKQYYRGSALKWGQDERFFANVLVEANRGQGLRGIYKPNDSDTWDKTSTREGYLIWIPSLKFAQSLHGKVKSGSPSHGIIYDLPSLWDETKHLLEDVADFTLGCLAFIAGIIHGALEAVWDSASGIIESAINSLIPPLWKITYNLICTDILSDTKNLWNSISTINISDLINAGIKSFKERWNNPDLHTRWHFRGWIIGYAIAEIIMTIITAGAAVVKWAAKAGRIGKLISRFPQILKLAQKAEQLTKPLRKIEQKVIQLSARALAKAPPKAKSSLSPPKIAKWAKDKIKWAKDNIPDTSSDTPPKAEISDTLSDAELEKQLAKFPNWENIKQFIGRAIPDEGASDYIVLKNELQAAGYRLDKLNSIFQSYRLSRQKGKATSNEYGALTVTKDNIIALKLKDTLRISVHSRCRKNYLDMIETNHGLKERRDAELRLAQGYVLHHLIPDAVARNNRLIIAAMKAMTGYTIDQGTNILDMPSMKAVPPDEAARELLHISSHKNYSAYVESLLEDELGRLPLGVHSSPNDLEAAIRRVETTLRETIKSKQLPKEILRPVYKDGIFKGIQITTIRPKTHKQNTREKMTEPIHMLIEQRGGT
jgi:hypothetical protein